jgi:thioredoxin reductase (NADPH)
MNDKIRDLIIIGGGPAGLTAAIYTSRAFIDTLVIEGSPHGGQLTITTDVENFPGFKDGVMGPALIEDMREQAKKFNAELLETNVTKVSGDKDSGFIVTTESGETLKSKAVLIASGATAKWLGLESETRLRGKGVSACATCDGFFFKGKEIAVVGGGDSAMEEANFLTKFATKVYILSRGPREKMRASKFMLDRASSNPKIEFIYNVEVKEVLGTESVTGLLLSDSTGGVDKTINVQGLFIAIGHSPNTGFLKGFIDLNEIGYVNVTNNTYTSKEGVFTAGDVADARYRQAITAAGFGCMAALDIEKFLAH